MTTSLQPSRVGLRLVCNVSSVPAPRVRGVYPIPQFSAATTQLLSVALQPIQETGRAGILVTSLGGILPGGPTATWTIRHTCWQGDTPPVHLQWDERPVTGAPFSLIYDQPMSSAMHSFRAVRVEGGQTTAYPVVSILTPADLTLAGLADAAAAAAAAKARLDAIASDGIVTPEERGEWKASYESYSQRYSSVRTAALSPVPLTSVSVLDTCWANYNAIVQPIALATGNSTVNFSDYTAKRGLLDRAIGDTQAAIGKAFKSLNEIDASTKADAAQAAAQAYAELKKTEAAAYADGIVDAEEARAIADALAKYNAAKALADAAQASANNAALLARDTNLIKNGNSEMDNPTGYEAAGISTTSPYQGAKHRSTSPVTPTYLTPKLQVWMGEQYTIQAVAENVGGGTAMLVVDAYNAAGTRLGDIGSASTSSAAYTQITGSFTIAQVAGQNVAFIAAYLFSTAGFSFFDNLYMERKPPSAIDAQNSANAASLAASNAAVAAAYADYLARSPNNLIKNGNSEDPNPTGMEASHLSPTYPYSGTKCRLHAGGSAYWDIGSAPCDPGWVINFEAMALCSVATDGALTLYLSFRNAAGSELTGSGGAGAILDYNTHKPISVSRTAPAGTVKVVFSVLGGTSGVSYWMDCFYACRKTSVGMLEADILKSYFIAGQILEIAYAATADGVPTAGVRMDGSNRPLRIGPGGALVGIRGYGGTYRGVSVDGAVAASLAVLRSTATDVADPLAYYAGNNPVRAVPNTARLLITPQASVITGNCQIATWDLTAYPTSKADALDALRYVEMEFYQCGATTPYRRIKPAISSRGYYDLAAHNVPLNTAEGQAVLTDRSHPMETSNAFGNYIRARLVGVDGPGAWLWWAPATIGFGAYGTTDAPWSGSPASGGGGAGGGGTPIGCVPAGTLLLMEDGSTIPIEQARAGMISAAWDDATLERIPGGARITRLWAFEDRELWDLETEHGQITASHDHRITLDGDTSWPPLRTAIAGQETRWEVDGHLVPSRIIHAAPAHRRSTVYHVSQERGHVYVAGGLAAHNAVTPIDNQSK